MCFFRSKAPPRDIEGILDGADGLTRRQAAWQAPTFRSLALHILRGTILPRILRVTGANAGGAQFGARPARLPILAKTEQGRILAISVLTRAHFSDICLNKGAF